MTNSANLTIPTEAKPVRIPVSLGGRSYDILVGAGLTARAGEWIAPLLKRMRVAIVTDEHVAALHLATLQAALQSAGITAVVKILPAGEGTKNFAQLESLLEWLIAEKIDRQDMIIAFGGGVIGDLTGFAAAILRRGIDFIQIPTTLLAQVDSSVGGKTAINSRQGKNLIGAFHQPRLVLADIDLLKTLPPREMQAGYAEVMKYGLLGDAGFFTWCEANGIRVLAHAPDALTYAVTASCRAKAAIVARDEREDGERALLNLGHTFGHAFEAETGFSQKLLHGEAVAIGMLYAFEFSADLQLCPSEAPKRLCAHLEAVGLPTHLANILPPNTTVESLIFHMLQDKKVSAGNMTFILAYDIGRAFITRTIERDDLNHFLARKLRG